jgi:hypothetical protein
MKKAKLKAASSPSHETGCPKNLNTEVSMFHSNIVPGKRKGGLYHVQTNFNRRH